MNPLKHAVKALIVRNELAGRQGSKAVIGYPGLLSLRAIRRMTIGQGAVIERVRFDGDIVVGDYSRLRDGTCIGTMVSIGKYSQIARDCYIGMGEHPTSWLTVNHRYFVEYSEEHGFQEGLERRQEVLAFNDKATVIENDVWIGSRAIIKRGITVHTGAVVAQGAVVTKDTPAFAIVGGVPAHLLRYRFDQIQI